MINITLNGQPEQVAEGITVTGLLAAIGLGEKRVAVEVNREIVPRSRHDRTVICDADQVEVVQAIGGG